MVGLYKDPEGDKIVIGLSSTIDRGSQNEVVELRRRISELEKSLQQRVRKLLLVQEYKQLQIFLQEPIINRCMYVSGLL